MRSLTDQQKKILKITALVVVTLPFVWFGFVFVTISIAASRNWSELELDESRLPRAVLALKAEFPNSHVEYHRLKNGFDLSMTDRGYLRIDGAEVVQKFIDINSLENTGGRHPKRTEFDGSLHLLSRDELIDGDVWFASPGFGTVHQEVVDLYLLRTNAERTSALVYHYWTF